MEEYQKFAEEKLGFRFKTSSSCSIVIFPARMKYSPVLYLLAINPAMAAMSFGTSFEKNPDVLQKVKAFDTSSIVKLFSIAISIKDIPFEQQFKKE